MPRRAQLHPALELTEAAFQSQVTAIASAYGWVYYHTHDSRRSVAGFPDLVLVNERQKRVLFVELKKTGGILTEAQLSWLRILSGSDAETAVWFPADLEQIKAVLAGRRIKAGE